MVRFETLYDQKDILFVDLDTITQVVPRNVPSDVTAASEYGKKLAKRVSKILKKEAYAADALMHDSVLTDIWSSDTLSDLATQCEDISTKILLEDTFTAWWGTTQWVDTEHIKNRLKTCVFNEWINDDSAHTIILRSCRANIDCSNPNNKKRCHRKHYDMASGVTAELLDMIPDGLYAVYAGWTYTQVDNDGESKVNYSVICFTPAAFSTYLDNFQYLYLTMTEDERYQFIAKKFINSAIFDPVSRASMCGSVNKWKFHEVEDLSTPYAIDSYIVEHKIRPSEAEWITPSQWVGVVNEIHSNHNPYNGPDGLVGVLGLTPPTGKVTMSPAAFVDNFIDPLRDNSARTTATLICHNGKEYANFFRAYVEFVATLTDMRPVEFYGKYGVDEDNTDEGNDTDG